MSTTTVNTAAAANVEELVANARYYAEKLKFELERLVAYGPDDLPGLLNATPGAFPLVNDLYDIDGLVDVYDASLR